MGFVQIVWIQVYLFKGWVLLCSGGFKPKTRYIYSNRMNIGRVV